MSMKTLIVTLAAMVGLSPIACSKAPEHKALEGPIRRANLTTTSPGDTFVRHGRISWTNEAFEFRECDTNELYFIDATLSMHDTLDQFIQSRTAAYSTPIYVRFYGEVIADDDDLPNRYEDVIRMRELLSYDASVPVVCK